MSEDTEVEVGELGFEISFMSWELRNSFFAASNSALSREISSIVAIGNALERSRLK